MRTLYGGLAGYCVSVRQHLLLQKTRRSPPEPPPYTFFVASPGAPGFLSCSSISLQRGGPFLHLPPLIQFPSISSCTNHRSEEHTSELQSLAYLVCRLLLEKKKKTVTICF